jgi:hypothetical protein
MTSGYSTVLDAWTEIPVITTVKTVSSGPGVLRLFGDSDDPSSFLSSSSVVQPTPAFTPSRTTTDTTPTTPNYDYETSKVDDLVKKSSITLTPPSCSTHEAYGLMPMADFFAFTWTDYHTAAVKRVLERVRISVWFAYDVCRKLYHYPLDPP